MRDHRQSGEPDPSGSEVLDRHQRHGRQPCQGYPELDEWAPLLSVRTMVWGRVRETGLYPSTSKGRSQDSYLQRRVHNNISILTLKHKLEY